MIALACPQVNAFISLFLKLLGMDICHVFAVVVLLMHSCPTLALDVSRMFVVGFDGTELSQEIEESIDSGVAGVILFRRNYKSVEQLLRLTTSLKERAARPFLIGVNQEGGRVQHLSDPFTRLPTMRDLGALNCSDVAFQFGRLVGTELRGVHVDINFAPVVDVNTNPNNPVIGDRALGSDPALVTRLGHAIVDGMQSAGVAACLKHFPGHGDTSSDSHLALPVVSLPPSELEDTHFKPFRDIIRSAFPAAVMTSHIIFREIDPDNPATMSQTVLTGLLREKFRFGGVVFSDSLEMRAVSNHQLPLQKVLVSAVNAGVDLFLVPHTQRMQRAAVVTLQKAVDDGLIPLQRLRDSFARTDSFFREFVKEPHFDGVDKVGCQEHSAMSSAWWVQSDESAAEGIDWKGNTY